MNVILEIIYSLDLKESSIFFMFHQIKNVIISSKNSKKIRMTPQSSKLQLIKHYLHLI